MVYILNNANILLWNKRILRNVIIAHHVNGQCEKISTYVQDLYQNLKLIFSLNIL